MADREIELKLGLAPADLARLRRHPLLAADRLGAPVTRRLRNIYFDTPDFELAAANVSLRIRAAGAKRVQTVKCGAPGGGALFDRGEWEVELAGERLDHDALRATRLAVFRDGDLAGHLRPAFTTDFHRTALQLGGEGWQVEVAFDRGHVLAPDGGRAPICEVELELKEGDPRHLFALAGRIAKAVPARLLGAAKSDRGLDLAQGRRPAPIKARRLELAPEMTVAEAFQAISRACLGHLLANEPPLLGNHDGEAVHQMRVALRRLRSAIKAFKPLMQGSQLAEAKGDVKWLLEHLGPARDADVLLETIIAPVLAERPGDAAIAALHAAWAADRDARLRAAEAAVAERRFTALMLDLAAWVEAGDWQVAGSGGDAPLAPFAAAVLAKCDRKMRKAGGGQLSQLPAEQLHQVRIRGKQLRYVADFFAALMPRKAYQHFAAILSELQDQLGLLNDIAVAEARLAAVEPDHRWAAGVLAGWHQARRAELMTAAEKAWKGYRKAARPWE